MNQKPCVNSCAATAGGATGVESHAEGFTTLPVSTPGGAANPTIWLLSTLNVATSAIVMDGGTTRAAGEMSAVLLMLSDSGASF